MRFFLLTILNLLVISTTFSQVGIGTTNIENSAVLEIKSESKGFLPPRMTTLEKHSIANPAEGLMVYSINSCNTTGALSFYSNGKWINIPNCTDSDFDDDSVPNSIDIDDDNDGILDILEQTTTTEKFAHTDANGVYELE